MPREDDIRPLGIDEPAVDDAQRARNRLQPAARSAQLLRLPLMLHAQQTDLGMHRAEFPDQFEEQPVLLVLGHAPSLMPPDRVTTHPVERPATSARLLFPLTDRNRSTACFPDGTPSAPRGHPQGEHP